MRNSSEKCDGDNFVTIEEAKFLTLKDIAVHLKKKRDGKETDASGINKL